jgi:hypothetical protein
MIQNIGSTIAHEQLSEAWVTRFLNRHPDTLTSKWSTGMDATRHKADSHLKYKLYFDLLHAKMKEYKVLLENLYYMDEKGFMIGVIGRSKRVFTPRQWEQKEVTAALQDGNRDWITALACICADGTALPPGIIYQSNNCTLQSSWVEDIKVSKHQVFTASSPSGWTNDTLGLAWLEQVFDRYTKQKARRGREWRLLIVDGHGSHLTEGFFDYCLKHRILLAVFPPHSTHTLQPLDVVCFKPFASAYSKHLTLRLQNTQGLVPIKKGDFFLLFWDAWLEAITKKTVLRSFEATGVWPMEREVIMKRFPARHSNKPSNEPASEWRRAERLLRTAVDKPSSEAKEVSILLHHMAVQNELLNDENKGLRNALNTKKKQNKNGKALDLQQHEEYHGGAVFWSPRAIHEARARGAVNERLKEEEKLKKAQMKDLQKANALYNKKIAEEKRVANAAKREEQKHEKAAKAAERAAKTAANNAKKALQTSQTGKRKASAPLTPKSKRQKPSTGGAAAAAMLPAALPKINSHGRTVKLPQRYT